MSRIILITGASRGIGLHLAQHYLSCGNIVAGCSRGDSDLQHDNYRHFKLDVSDEAAVTAMVRTVNREFGRIDALINNAGIASMNHIATTPLASVEKIFAANFFGTFLFVREVGKAMVRKRRGTIINFSTVAVPLNLEGEAVYAASKAAVESFTRIAAREFAPFNVRVNAVGPAPIATDLVRNVPEEKMNKLLAQMPFSRFAQAEDVAHIIDFFMDDKSGMITGQCLYLGGAA